jgi:predicted DNA-binding transcriptional regulator AlpA
MSDAVPSPAAPNSPSLLTAAQLATLLGVRDQTLAEWRVLGTGPRFVRLSARAIRYRRADVDAWLDAQARASTRDTGATPPAVPRRVARRARAALPAAPHADAPGRAPGATRGRGDGRTAA